MIPAQDGKFIIPEISIPWWNTRTGKQEHARLPETVIEATGMASTAQVPPIEMLAPLAQTDEQQAESSLATAAASDETIINPGYWPWISLALAVGWITTTLLFFSNNRSASGGKKTATLPPILPLQRAVDKACSKGDAIKTKNALLEWAAVRWPDQSITSLADIAKVSSAELSTQINCPEQRTVQPACRSTGSRKHCVRPFMLLSQTSTNQQKHRILYSNPFIRPDTANAATSVLYNWFYPLYLDKTQYFFHHRGTEYTEVFLCVKRIFLFMLLVSLFFMIKN